MLYMLIKSSENRLVYLLVCVLRRGIARQCPLNGNITEYCRHTVRLRNIRVMTGHLKRMFLQTEFVIATSGAA